MDNKKIERAPVTKLGEILAFAPTQDQKEYLEDLIEWRKRSESCICLIGGPFNPKCPIHRQFAE